MAERPIYADLNGFGVAQLKGFRIHNIADATAQTAFESTGNNGAALGADNYGLAIYRVDLKQIGTWDGTQFNFSAIEMTGDVIFKGMLDASLAIDNAGQPQPIEAVSGYQYVVSVAGTFDAGTSGVTLQGNQALEVGDLVLFTSATEAYSIQRNDVYATDTIAGNVRLASQADVDGGTVADEAVTPLTLQEKLDGQFYVRQYSATVNIAALTPLTVTHNLGLVDKDSFTINTMRAGTQISVDVDSVDANSITLTSLVALSNVRVTVQGAKA